MILLCSLLQPHNQHVHSGVALQTFILTVLLTKMISVDSLASTPPFQYNFLTSSELKQQLKAHR